MNGLSACRLLGKISNANKNTKNIHHFVYNGKIIQMPSKTIEKAPPPIVCLKELITAALKHSPAPAKISCFAQINAELRKLYPATTPEATGQIMLLHRCFLPLLPHIFKDIKEGSFPPVVNKISTLVKENYYDENHISQCAAQLALLRGYSAQTLLKELYHGFYQLMNPKSVSRDGTIYTPEELVDFMLTSADFLVRRNFNEKLAGPKINIYDPFTGTGIFPAQLLKKLHTSAPGRAGKARNNIYFSELNFLSYYVACINITWALAPATLPLPKNSFCGDVFARPRELQTIAQHFQGPGQITVVVSNPPYSAGQKSVNNDNKNETYWRGLDQEIKDSYAKASAASNKRYLYNSYVRAIKSGLGLVSKGVLALIVPNSFVDGKSMDGLRKVVAEQCAEIWVVNLRGDIKNVMKGITSSAQEEENVFGNQCSLGIALAFFVRRPKATGPVQIYYYDSRARPRGVSKLEWIKQTGTLAAVPVKKLTPDNNHDWINQRDKAYDGFLTLDPKVGGVFDLKSLGSTTCRDRFVVNSAKAEVIKNTRRHIAYYNELLRELRPERMTPAEIDQALRAAGALDKGKIKWSYALRAQFAKGEKLTFNARNIRIYNYRPFFQQHVYYDPTLVESHYNQRRIFPNEAKLNHALVTGTSQADFSCFCVKNAHDYYYILNSQTFPLINYRQETPENNIKPGVLTALAEIYKVPEINEKEFFAYVYGVLHAPVYREKYKVELAKGIAKIPVVTTPAVFQTFAYYGQHLINLHANYLAAPLYPALTLQKSREDYYVKKMKWLDAAQTELKFNEHIVIKNIPKAVHRYTVNGKPCLWWVLNKHQVRTDRATGIVNDPNWFSEDPQYIFKLVQKVIYLSLKTQEIQEALPRIITHHADFKY